ncbi:MAG: DEAD/DEAH box helicase [Deltaproteobacteria bacterium]|nr:DEAD/DEAH box helicase [Deltaproteobacteria bacterium]
MSLAQALQNEFTPEVKTGGDEYFRTRRVRLVVTRPALLTAEVQGQESYRVYLTPDGYEEYGAYCSCATFQRYECCEHLWAALLEADSRRFAWLKESRPGYLVPLEPADLLEDGVEADPAVSRPPARSWRSRLSEVRASMREALATSAAPAADFEIVYVLDVDLAVDKGLPVLELRSRRRRASGDWGTLRPFRPAPEELPRLAEPLDRQLLSALQGARPEAERRYHGFASVDDVVDAYLLDSANAGLLVPLLCKTGRFFLRQSGVLQEEPQVWEGGAPWVLGLAVSSNGHGGDGKEDLEKKDTEKNAGTSEEDSSELRGFLERGSERMDLSEPDLLLMYGQVFAKGKAAPFDPRGAFPWVSLLREHAPLKTSGKEREALIEAILDLPAQPILDLPEPWTVGDSPPPKPELEVERVGKNGGSPRRIGCRLRFNYGGSRVEAGEPRQILRKPETQTLFSRDLEAEKTYTARLMELGARRAPALDRQYAAYLAPSRFPELVRALVREGWRVRADGRTYRPPGVFKLSVSSGMDWFDLHGKATFDRQVVDLPELLAAARSGADTVRLGDGSVGLLPEQWLERCGLLANLAMESDDGIRFANSQAFLLDALLASAESELELDKTFAQFRDQLHHFEGIYPQEEADGFEGALRDYQRQALGWFAFLRDFGIGGCLADDMGLGKTVQVLALFEERRRKGEECRPNLVVVPRSLVFNWLQEAERFTPGIKTLNYTGPQRKTRLDEIVDSDLVVTTYGILRRDILQLRELAFSYVVLDEAQAIKNASSQAAKAARLLKAKHRLALSGTPVENHLGELWSLFEFLNPGMLGRNTTFRKLAAQGSGLDGGGKELLAKAVRPFILRRTKEQVIKDLPAKFEQTLYCEMEARQLRLYDELRVHYRASLLERIGNEGLGGSHMKVLEALLRLRQAACHPGLIDEERRSEASAKLDVLLPKLLEVCDQGHRALVFSQFTSLLAVVRDRLEELGLEYEYLDGQTRDRQQRVERFQSADGPSVFLISLKAGGLGLNLTAADYVFILDPWWNPAAEAQAIDRAHRIGQTRRVMAYRLICRDTVEEKIIELQKSKRELAEAIISTDGSVLKNLSRQDLEQLLS